jgi:retron-type reverse transcriptase
VLRVATKDRSSIVRRAAFQATRALLLDEVALPDFHATRRRPDRRGINPFTKQEIVIRGGMRRLGGWLGAKVGGFNPTGWRFGLYAPPARTHRPHPAFQALKTADDVARLVGKSEARELTRWLRPGVGPGTAYVQFEIPKASGGVRHIAAPRAELKEAQRLILRKLLDALEPHPASHAFVTGRSTLTNATPHVGARIVLKMDLADFFPTIHFGRIIGLFEQYGASKAAARSLAALVTYRPTLDDGRVAWPSILPQGAPTSPAIANLVCRRMDARLAALAEDAAARYTRYADDLTFSFKAEPSRGIGRFVWWVGQICGQEGFFENVKKRRILRPSSQLRVTGLVVNERVSIPREARRRFRAVLDHCRRFGVSVESVRHPEPEAYLMGFVSYVSMIDPPLGRRWHDEVRALLEK